MSFACYNFSFLISFSLLAEKDEKSKLLFKLLLTNTSDKKHSRDRGWGEREKMDGNVVK